MATGLNESRLVNVQVNLTTQAAASRSFAAGLGISTSNAINVLERLRAFASTEEIAQVFGVNTPEYLAGVRYFSQLPRPGIFYIGRWAQTATSAFLIGAELTPAEQDILTWNNITAASCDVTIDGTVYRLSNVDFTGETNLNGICSQLNSQIPNSPFSWSGKNFFVTSPTTGAASTVDFLIPAGVGTDISSKMKLTITQAQNVPGVDLESPLDAVVALTNASNAFYAFGFAVDFPISDLNILDIAGYVESLQVPRTYWLITQNPQVKSAASTTDIASLLKDGRYTRTFVQYSEPATQQNLVDVFSAMARLITTDFTANNSTITLMYKQEPTVNPLVLTTQEANTLQAKNVNVFAKYDNDTAIIQYGTMSGNVYADEIIGVDWFANAIQTACYNTLYTSTTKVPQTDAGQNILVNACSAVCNQAVNNGLVAPGQWNGSPFGQLSTGDFLPTGFYIYSPPMAAQSQSIREQRISQTIQIAIKLAGAIHQVNVIVNVNR